MNFRRYTIILAVLLLAVLTVQPVLCQENLSEAVASRNMTAVLSAKNVAGVINQTDELMKDNASLYYNYGAQTLNAGDLDTALMYFEKALAENTSMINQTNALKYLYEGKAYILIQKKQYADAITAINAGLAINPKDPLLWNNKGYALSLLGKQPDALKAYDAAIALDGNYTTALLNKGDLLARMGQYPDAIAAFTRANETDPGNEAAAAGLATAKKGEAESATTTTIVAVIAIIIAAGVCIWYLKFRKPSEPAPEDKKKETKKKE